MTTTVTVLVAGNKALRFDAPHLGPQGITVQPGRFATMSLSGQQMISFGEVDAAVSVQDVGGPGEEAPPPAPHPPPVHS